MFCVDGKIETHCEIDPDNPTFGDYQPMKVGKLPVGFNRQSITDF